MNRNLSIFLTATALAATGVFVGRALTDDDTANATPRIVTITRDGTTARIHHFEVNERQRGLGDGGVTTYLVFTACGSAREVTTLNDGGSESATRDLGCIDGELEVNSAHETRLNQVLSLTALPAFRAAKNLEK